MKTRKMLFAIAFCVMFFLPSLMQVLPFGKDLGWASCFAQNVGINATGVAPNNSALLDINASPGNNKGLLIPRVALSATNSNAPIGAGIATSLLVYNTATVISPPNSVIPGYYYWDATKWVSLSGGTGGNDWGLLGNASTVDGTNFIGTTDNIPFNIRIGNQKAGRIALNGEVFLGYQAGNSNTATATTGIGYQALTFNTTGAANTAIGGYALYTNTTGYSNTAIGQQALYGNNGNYNTAIGYVSLNANTSGSNNTATGVQSLYTNSTGSNNTATGVQSLNLNTSGGSNTAIGYQALYKNTTGFANTAIGSGALTWGSGTGNYNTATGYQSLDLNSGNYNTANGTYALYQNSSGTNNTAVGSNALYNNNTGWYNTAIGYEALDYNTSGNYNTASGYQSLWNNTIGSYNTANGLFALFSNTGDFNTAIGYRALYANTTGANNTALGDYALSMGAGFFDATAIGYGAQSVGSYTMIFGDASVTGLYTMGGGWFAASDERFKNKVEETVPGLSFITKLRPVTYHYDMDNIAAFLHTPDSLRLKEGEALKSKILYSGFIAQEVEKAANEIGYNFNGISKPKNDKDYYAIDYASFVVPLVKAMQELNAEKESLKLEVQSLKSENAVILKRLEALENK